MAPGTTLAWAIITFSLLTSGLRAQTPRWSDDKAKSWYDQQFWLVGSNYIPADAINELEMWQAQSFNAAQIEKELGWAESLGMNTMRVFLHDLLWQENPEGFKKRIDQFLQISSRHHIKPLFVLFDSCWDPQPKLGVQHPPIPGVHNSGWVQSPGSAALADPAQEGRLKAYVVGVVGAFANDARVLGWDVWNEPSNTNEGSYPKLEPSNKQQLVELLLPKVFAWAREAHPSQPLTSGVWDIDFENGSALTKTQQIQLENSDVISFHNYGWPESFEKEVIFLEKFHRPLICTEFMAAEPAAPLTQSCHLLRNTKWQQLTGASSRARRKRTTRGIPGGILTFSISPPCGSMKSFIRMGSLIGMPKSG